MFILYLCASQLYVACATLVIISTCIIIYVDIIIYVSLSYYNICRYWQRFLKLREIVQFFSSTRGRTRNCGGNFSRQFHRIMATSCDTSHYNVRVVIAGMGRPDRAIVMIII